MRMAAGATAADPDERPRRTFEVAATRRIQAPAAAVYEVFADYREAHPRILPPRFFVGLTVEAGGHGDGTVILVSGRFAGRTRVIRGIVSEPEPGVLVERYPAERMVTTFRVVAEPDPGVCQVTIASALPRRWGPPGWLEERLVRRLLTGVFAEELERVEDYLRGGGEGAPA